MQPNLLPEIDESDLKAAREFLGTGRDEPLRPRPRPSAAREALASTVTVHHGITRARHRHKAPSGA